MPTKISELATARSGDKGNHANIGVVAHNEHSYAILKKWLTSEVVAEYFRSLGATEVRRYELPRVQSLNFVLYNSLGGGASESLRIDTQGKLLATALLEQELPE
ncbi:MAG: hypothetical protein MPJ24_00235 [Pirellulaceae bacterium]|nr:hypothetical protein [Pirellulaceae bacterium]